MTVRLAVKEDLPELLKFVSEWVIYNMMLAGFTYDEKVFSDNVLMLINGQTAVLVIEDNKIVGGIGGRLTNCFYSKDLIFDVAMFYMDPEYRHLTPKALEALETIMAKTSVTKIIIGNPYFDDFNKHQRFYKMKGYRSLQMSLVKEIKRETSHAS